MTFASRLRGQRQARLSLHCAERLPQRDAVRPITTSAPRPAAAARAAHPQPARSTAAHRPRADQLEAERMRRFGVRAQGVEMAVGSELLVGAHAARDIMPHAIPCRAGCGILCHVGRHGCQFCGARCAVRCGHLLCSVQLYNVLRCGDRLLSLRLPCRAGYTAMWNAMPCATTCAATIACCRAGHCTHQRPRNAQAATARNTLHGQWTEAGHRTTCSGCDGSMHLGMRLPEHGGTQRIEASKGRDAPGGGGSGREGVSVCV